MGKVHVLLGGTTCGFGLSSFHRLFLLLGKYIER